MLEEGRNGWCKGGGGELQMQADGEGDMNGIQSTEGGVAFERGGDTSSIETRSNREAEFRGASFQYGNLRACLSSGF